MAAVLDGIVGFNANDLAGLRIYAQRAAVAAVDDAGGPGVVAEVVDRVGHGLRESRRHEAGRGKSGPLAGLTFSVKDMFDVAGFPTSAGSPTMLAASGIKTKTACAVQQLLDAGARFIGKAVTDELAFSVIGNNAHFGIPVNGAAPERYAGGSSSGSASSVS